MIWPVLRKGFATAHSRVYLVLRDIVWKFLWCVFTAVLIFGFGVWLIADIGSLSWDGPDLTTASPIVWLVLLQQLWNAYSGMLFWTLAAVFLIAVFSWLVLEAYFRGGRKNFWVFLGSSVARSAILGTTGLLLGVLSYRQGDGTAMFTSAIVMLGIWYLVRIAETLIRADAVELFGTQLLQLSAAMGVFLALDLLVGWFAIALSVSAFLLSSQPSEFIAALALTIMLMVGWTVLHSYLMVVRISTVDIMRRNDVSV